MASSGNPDAKSTSFEPRAVAIGTLVARLSPPRRADQSVRHYRLRLPPKKRAPGEGRTLLDCWALCQGAVPADTESGPVALQPAA